jgi:hypothetical protein
MYYIYFQKEVGKSYLLRNLRNMHNRETSLNTNLNLEVFSFPSFALLVIVLALLLLTVATGSATHMFYFPFSPVITKEEPRNISCEIQDEGTKRVKEISRINEFYPLQKEDKSYRRRSLEVLDPDKPCWFMFLHC